MFAGHFGVAAAVKSKTPQIPLWSLLVSTQLLDLVFFALSTTGLETMEPLGDGGYTQVMIYAFYTHSLLGALVLSILAAGLAAFFWGKIAGLVIGAVAFSHWILDLIVHRPDLPILPGNAGEFPLLGLGLWNSFPASFLLEFLLITIGAFLYFRYALRSSGPKRRARAITSGCIMAVFLLLCLGFDVLA
ncbi:permease [Terribacillus halophilus]|uniref:permease n=1 Tax=Terribacillus halophilus TaxID=361279 RepID=UPI00098479E3|nr:permease [Terribacillus halophilus]